MSFETPLARILADHAKEFTLGAPLIPRKGDCLAGSSKVTWATVVSRHHLTSHRKFMDRRLMILATVAAAMAPSAALARRGGRVRMSGGLSNGARHSGPTLSRNELRDCVKREDDINQLGLMIDSDQQVNEKRHMEIKRLGSGLEMRRASLDRTSQDEIDSYNAMVGRHRKLVQTYNDSLPESNAKVERHAAQVASFNSSCAGKAFYETDMNAVRAEK